jgi:hypothetical protein
LRNSWGQSDALSWALSALSLALSALSLALSALSLAPRLGDQVIAAGRQAVGYLTTGEHMSGLTVGLPAVPWPSLSRYQCSCTYGTMDMQSTQVSWNPCTIMNVSVYPSWAITSYIYMYVQSAFVRSHGLGYTSPKVTPPTACQGPLVAWRGRGTQKHPRNMHKWTLCHLNPQAYDPPSVPIDNLHQCKFWLPRGRSPTFLFPLSLGQGWWVSHARISHRNVTPCFFFFGFLSSCLFIDQHPLGQHLVIHTPDP